MREGKREDSHVRTSSISTRKTFLRGRRNVIPGRYPCSRGHPCVWVRARGTPVRRRTGGGTRSENWGMVYDENGGKTGRFRSCTSGFGYSKFFYNVYDTK